MTKVNVLNIHVPLGTGEIMDQFGTFCLVTTQQQLQPNSLGIAASCILRTNNTVLLEHKTLIESRLQDVYRR